MSMEGGSSWRTRTRTGPLVKSYPTVARETILCLALTRASDCAKLKSMPNYSSVVCPGCRKRFQVSEQFAGKSGPCPHCKATINIPAADQEVKIHAPEPVSKASVTGAHLVLKPIKHRDMKWRAGAAGAIAGGTLAVFLVCYVAQPILRETAWLRAIGLALVSPLLVMAGYAFLYDDETEPYRAKSLYLRSGILAAAFIALWGVYSYRVAPNMIGGEVDVWLWFIVPVPFLIIGALASLACLDLEFGNGFFLYCFYLIVTIFLGWAAGLGWPWAPVSRDPAGDVTMEAGG